MRFLRPTLVVGDHQVLATLEHKPWAPVEGTSWVAEFPWSGTDGDLAHASLEVAPSVLVPVGPDARREGVPRRRPREQRESVLKHVPTSTDAATDLEHLRPRPLDPLPAAGQALPPAGPAPADAAPAPAPEGRAPAHQEAPDPGPELRAAADPAPGDRGAPGAGPDPAAATPTPDSGRDAPPQPDHRMERIRGLQRELRAVETARDAEAHDARSIATALDRARAQLDEAVRDREAAVRTRDRLDEQREEAVAAARAAERRAREEVAAAQRDRDDAAAQRDAALQQAAQLKAQRDEALLAHRSLQQILDAERAQREREAGPAPAAPAPRRSADRGEADADDDTPLGIRAVPAARAVPADLLGPRPGAKPALGGFDRWVLRVLALATATCFLLLLVMLLSVFV